MAKKKEKPFQLGDQVIYVLDGDEYTITSKHGRFYHLENHVRTRTTTKKDLKHIEASAITTVEAEYERAQREAVKKKK
jgi:hypothetical protein